MATKKTPAKKVAAKKTGAASLTFVKKVRTKSTPGPKPRFEDSTRTGMLLPEMTKRKAHVLGNGNISEGVRIAVDKAYDAYQKG